MGRFKAIPETTAKRMPIYVVIDTVTKEWKHVYGCFLWAERKADELNNTWNPCNTCAFSDCPKDYHACLDCDDRRYKE